MKVAVGVRDLSWSISFIFSEVSWCVVRSGNGMCSYVFACISISLISSWNLVRRKDQSYNVLFKQVTGIRSPVLHGLISVAGSANAVLKDWKKATNATSAGDIRGMTGVCMCVEIWRVITTALFLKMKLLKDCRVATTISHFLVLYKQAQGPSTHLSPCVASGEQKDESQWLLVKAL